MKIDPFSEVKYRFKLSIEYLKKAEKFLKSGDYKESVEASQLSAENAAKAIVALKRIPSWSHDPFDELLEVALELPDNKNILAKELANLAHELAPEHGITTYGKPAEGIMPWEIYDKTKAQEAFNKAKRANELMNLILRDLK